MVNILKKFMLLPSKAKAWIAGSAAFIFIILLVNIWIRNKIKQEAKRLEAQRISKELSARVANSKEEKKVIEKEIAELNKKIKTNKEMMKGAEDKFKERLDVSRLNADKKISLWNEIYGNKED